MNTRRKGQRTLAKAIKILEEEGSTALKFDQAARGKFSTPQPFDLLVLKEDCWPSLIEVRSNQWGVSKPQTIELAKLPDGFLFKQIWMFKDGENFPSIRQWNSSTQKWYLLYEPTDIRAEQ